ncbi:LuxR family transcriptional regulator [Pseudomonas sp. RIT-PI-S]|uniref:helix-turn-helix transcriptional regulator n=1 Tax=Pseudomonas sp. RIT-PI-S TaxID=3035295 RepID=UPI0021DB7748|nr:LuxR family transcriptional regulator [Pseudomonas sp. RIT-PI-S]
MGLLDDCLQLLSAANTDAWLDILTGAANKLGYTRVLFGLKPGKDAPNAAAVVLGNFHQAWRRRYDAAGYASVDPTVSHSFASALPLIWVPELYRNDAQRQFAEEAAAAGLSHGLTLPIHGPQGQVGMLSLSCDAAPKGEYLAQVQASLGDAVLLRDYAMASGASFLAATQCARPHLTPREREILSWAAFGKTSWEIGTILGISEPAVEFHFKNIRRKLKVSSRRLAVARAMQLDLISP